MNRPSFFNSMHDCVVNKFVNFFGKLPVKSASNKTTIKSGIRNWISSAISREGKGAVEGTKTTLSYIIL